MLNNPFCYSPTQEIIDAAHRLISRIDSSEELKTLFSEGKMMGVLKIEKEDGTTDFIYAFSGTAGGRTIVDGFVPPIFNFTKEDIRAHSAEHSRELQKWLFDNYIVLNGLGERCSIWKIFESRGIAPPGGTGECAAPKLLQFAFLNGYKPVAMGEFWYGNSPSDGAVRRNGCFYPSCTGKCGPLLKYMLRGVDVEPNPLESDLLWSLAEPFIHYEDRDIIVVDKPSGMLSVPGKSRNTNLQRWLEVRCGCEIFPCHRLDMDTSGLMVFAKNEAAQVSLQRQFENREVTKNYIARLTAPALSGIPLKGKICLPLMLDYYDRPRQKVDFNDGKQAVTEYEILHTNSDGTTDVRLTPHTGRTHQLRIHCASASGLDRPIVGDRLYGGSIKDISERLMLHSAYISFRHPASMARMTFKSEWIDGSADK